MATGHVFKTSDDVGAPSMRNVAGDLIAVLDWALDVGVGTYWQKVFTGTNKAVYRATTGHRYYLRVDDTGTTVAQVRAYGSMTSVDVGTDIFPDAVQASTFFFYKSSTATPTRYNIVADSRFFMLLCAAANADVYPLIFGEASPLDATDSFHTMLMASSVISVSGNQPSYVFAGSLEGSTSFTGRIFWARMVDGVTASSNGGLQVGALGSAIGGDLTLAAVPAITQVRAWDAARYSNMTSGFARAMVPYLYCLPYSYNAAILPRNTDFTVGSSTFRGYDTGVYAVVRTSNDEPGRI